MEKNANIIRPDPSPTGTEFNTPRTPKVIKHPVTGVEEELKDDGGVVEVRAKEHAVKPKPNRFTKHASTEIKVKFEQPPKQRIPIWATQNAA